MPKKLPATARGLIWRVDAFNAKEYQHCLKTDCGHLINEFTFVPLAQTFFRNKKIKVSQEIINVLVGRSRGDRANLFNELNKIEILSITKKNIDLDDVLKLTNLSENYSVFELVENYLAKNKRQVSKILNENNFANDECILIFV